MAAIEIFASPIEYKYKCKLYSLTFAIVLMLVVLSLLTPFIVIYNAGGFSLRNRVYTENPRVSFNYKYLLLADRGNNIKPIVCSTFKTYKENEIEDNCILVKIREVDANRDGKKEILKFEAHFYTDKPINSIKALLFFNFQLKNLFEISIESIALFTYVFNEEIQTLQFYGDLILQQNALLTTEGLYEIHNSSIDIFDYSVDEAIVQNFKRKFSAKITNIFVTKQRIHTSDDPIVIKGELVYREHTINYQPSVWEELKWAWIQYLSCFIVFAYIVKHVLIFLFTNRYLSCYVIVPWKNK